MCACMPVCFQRNIVTFAKARPAQMIFITTSYALISHLLSGYVFVNHNLSALIFDQNSYA